jgi:hypothetical protein
MPDCLAAFSHADITDAVFRLPRYCHILRYAATTLTVSRYGADAPPPAACRLSCRYLLPRTLLMILRYVRTEASKERRRKRAMPAYPQCCAMPQPRCDAVIIIECFA